MQALLDFTMCLIIICLVGFGLLCIYSLCSAASDESRRREGQDADEDEKH